MTNSGLLVGLLIGIVLGGVIGWLMARMRTQTTLGAVQTQLAAAQTALELERAAAREKMAALQQARDELTNSFGALAGQALKHNSDEFLKLAQENLKQFHISAQGDLSQKEKAIETLLNPIREALQKTEAQMHAIEKDRKESFGSLTQQLQSLTQTQHSLQHETRQLVQALRRPEVRGQWGELTLKRLVELSGMVEHCDFFRQETTDSGSRPDMVVRLPGQREIVVDVKTPLDAYLSAMETTDTAAQNVFLVKHAQNVRNRVRELASKSYWSQFRHSPDFVVLFIPGDQFLNAALDQDRTLLEDALTQKVILATPTSLIAVLRAVAYGWQQQVLAENAEQVREIGAELYKRLSVFSEHLTRLGRQLGSAVDSYNKSVGSFDRQVMSGARRFTEMGIPIKKTIEEPEPIATAVRGDDVDTNIKPMNDNLPTPQTESTSP